MRTPTHIAFADESNINGRFRAVTAIGLQMRDSSLVEGGLRRALEAAGVTSEFKWEKVRDAKYREAAIRLIDVVFEHFDRLRVDALVWDTDDDRHAVPGRDDIANLALMYRTLFKKVARRDGLWVLRPDEQTCLNWRYVNHLITTSMMYSNTVDRSLISYAELARVVQDVGIHRIVECRSHRFPLVQVADLFGGVAWWSRQHFDDYRAWTKRDHLELGGAPAPTPTKVVDARSRMLQHLRRRCREHNLPVSLETAKGFETFRSCGLDIWPYRAQRPEDQAPRKRGFRAGAARRRSAPGG